MPVRVFGSGRRVVVLAHGAGSHQDHPGVTGLRDALVAEGLAVTTFDYPYRVEEGRRAVGSPGERRRRPPDRAPVLLGSHRAVVDWVRAHAGEEIVLAGRSMGGRMSTMLAAEGLDCRGVVLYAYPLHPPGRPDRLRVDHLGAVPVPMLFFQGDRDSLSRPDLFDRHVRPLENVTVVDVTGGDHSFRVKGRTTGEINGLLARETAQWAEGLPGG